MIYVYAKLATALGVSLSFLTGGHYYWFEQAGPKSSRVPE